MTKNFWLMKSEPEEFSIQDLKEVEKEPWGGVRNYQARNFIRDQIAIGDSVLLYYSSTKIPGVAGVMTVVSEPFPDPSQFDGSSSYFDSKATQENPRWYAVNVKFEKEFDRFVPLSLMKQENCLKEMIILKKGNRLSITPISKEEFYHVLKMGKK